jgi:hypothetical protein
MASYTGTGGSVVECSPATRAARVRFPASAFIFFVLKIFTSQIKLFLPFKNDL